MLKMLVEMRNGRPDMVVIGTDPIMSIVLAPFVKMISPKTQVVQWCFDLYPEALDADDLVMQGSWLYSSLRKIADFSYRRADAIVDIGRCMRQRILAVAPHLKFATISPWAMKEVDSVPEVDPALRSAMYGKAKIACHYSGNLGHAHDFALFLRLAEKFSSEDLVLRFSVRGSRVDELNEAVKVHSSKKISVDDLVPESQLENHLRTADIHLVSLRGKWSGIVVPSKFFGALAVGRPVLYAGPPDSEIARIIVEYRVGWVLNEESLDKTYQDLSVVMADPGQRRAMQIRCLELYRKMFSKAAGIERFDQFISGLLSGEQV
jgi:glycosyltransferase involved in cell wall biosynthesis